MLEVKIKIEWICFLIVQLSVGVLLATQKSHGFITRDGIKPNSLGGIAIDSYGRTNIQGVYAAGDASVIAPAQIIIAAAEGVRAAAGVNMDLTQKELLE